MSRLSTHITRNQVENLSKAAEFAAEIGLPLNRFITILWERAEIIGRVQDIQARFLERMRKWLQYHGAQAAWLWVVERGREMGLHGHIVVHVPSSLYRAWKKMLPNWLDGQVGSRTIHVASVRYGERRETRLNPVRGLLKYLLKGASERAAFDLGIRMTNEGTVMGKRVGTSQNLGPAARRTHLTGSIGAHPMERARDDVQVEDTSPSVSSDSAEVTPDLLEIPEFLKRKRTFR